MTNKFSIDINDFDAFIFDMDGLLIDTERICWECFKRACKSYNYEPDFDIYKNCIGRSAVEGNKILAEGFKSYIPYNEVNHVWNNIYHDAIENEPIPLKEGIKEFLDNISNYKLKKAVATSTCYNLAVRKLKNTGLYNYFEIIISGEQVVSSKPDPEIYIKTANLLRVKPEKCLAFEDSDNGVRSAYRAGMTVIQIKDLIEPSKEVTDFKHTILSSITELELK